MTGSPDKLNYARNNELHDAKNCTNNKHFLHWHIVQVGNIIDPLQPSENPKRLINIVTGRIAPDHVYVDESLITTGT